MCHRNEDTRIEVNYYTVAGGRANYDFIKNLI